MKASEGRIGRIFVLRLEDGDNGPEAIEKFAAENGIHAGQVSVMSQKVYSGIIASDADGRPGLRLHGDATLDHSVWVGSEVVIQEILGIQFLRVKDPSSGQETLTRVAATKTRVMTRPSPEPEEKGPGTIPVYLFNAEFN